MQESKHITVSVKHALQTLINKRVIVYLQKKGKTQRTRTKGLCTYNNNQPTTGLLSLSIKIAWLIALLSCGYVKLKEF